MFSGSARATRLCSFKPSFFYYIYHSRTLSFYIDSPGIQHNCKSDNQADYLLFLFLFLCFRRQFPGIKKDSVKEKNAYIDLKSLPVLPSFFYYIYRPKASSFH